MKRMPLVLGIGVVLCCSNAFAESWYYVDMNAPKEGNEKQCVLLPNDQTPQQSLQAYVGPDIKIGLDRTLASGSRLLILDSPSGSHYAYATSQEDCLAMHAEIRQNIAEAKQKTSSENASSGQPKYFAYSQPYHGNQVLFLSKQRCSVPMKGVDSALLSRFEVQAPSPNKEQWSAAILRTKFGSAENCWTNIKKGENDGVLTCNIENGMVSSHCTVLAKNFFLDASSLPPPPEPARF